MPTEVMDFSCRFVVAGAVVVVVVVVVAAAAVFAVVIVGVLVVVAAAEFTLLLLFAFAVAAFAVVVVFAFVGSYANTVKTAIRIWEVQDQTTLVAPCCYGHNRYSAQPTVNPPVQPPETTKRSRSQILTPNS